MKWLASPPAPPPEFWDKLMGSFPATLDDINWFDCLWFAAFLFFSSPLMVKILKGEMEVKQRVIGGFVLLAFFFIGWSVVGYFTR